MLDYSELLRRLIKQESGGNPRAVSKAGALGLMQLMPGTARETAGRIGLDLPADDAGFREALFDPATNQKIGESYFKSQLDAFGGDQAAALVAYNGGPGRARRWLAGGRNDALLPAETRNYYRSILGMRSPTPEQSGVVPFILPQTPETPMKSFGGGSNSILGEDWGPILGALGVGILQGDDIGDGIGRGMSMILPMMEERRQRSRRSQALQGLLGGGNLGLSPEMMGYLTDDPELGGAVAQAYIKQRLFPDPPEQSKPSSIVADLKAAGLTPGTPEWREAITNHYAKDRAAPNLQLTEIYDPATGGKRKVQFNPATGELMPIGGVAAPDAPRETALDKAKAKSIVDQASTSIESAAAARRMLPIVSQLEAISKGDQGDLERAIGPSAGYEFYQSTIGQVPGLGSPALHAKISNLAAQLNADLGRVWLAGQGSASDTERKMVQDAIGKLTTARNKEEFDNQVRQIKTRINQKLVEGAKANKAVPGLDVLGGEVGGSNPLAEARRAIARGADRNAVIQRLRQNGIDPAGL